MKAICLLPWETVSFLGLLFLEAYLHLELGILDDLVQSRSNLRVQHLEVWKILSWKRIARTSIRPMNQPSPLPRSITLLPMENQVVTWVWNRIFQTRNDCGLGNLSNCNSDICCLTMKFCIVELVVHGFVGNVAIGIDLVCLHLCEWSSSFQLQGTASRFLCTW